MMPRESDIIGHMSVVANPTISSRLSTLPLHEAVARAAILPLTIEQYHRMIEEGIVPEDSSIELLRGVLVRKDRSSPGEDPKGHSARHRLVDSLLTVLASRINSASQFMQIQLPVDCPLDGAPEPDAAIVRGTPRTYSERAPRPEDVSCVVEVSDSSLDRDRDDKLPIYAEAGIPQYVIVNLVNNTVEVYSDPDAEGKQYRTRGTLERGATLHLNLGDGKTLSLLVDAFLP